jgi:hypothetical protein
MECTTARNYSISKKSDVSMFFLESDYRTKSSLQSTCQRWPSDKRRKARHSWSTIGMEGKGRTEENYRKNSNFPENRRFGFILT